MRAAVAFIACLIAAPALAGMPPGMTNPQVRPANASAGLPAVDDNLAAGGYPIAGGICAEWGHQVPCNNHYATTRASTKYVSASDGLYASVPVNVMAMGSGNGSLIEEARTNLALWSRDLTQSGTWIAVTMTAAKNAVGIDGAANSATTLTSTSAAGTILQSLTQASAAYTYTVYVKGVTVTGAIQVADYPVLTPAFTTLSASNCTNAAGVGTAPASGQVGFLKCSVTATSLNPVIGFKFANSGDSIVADFNQLEAGSFGTSPMLTTSATFTRSADNVSAIGLLATILSTMPMSVMFASPGLQSPTSQSFATMFGSSNIPTVLMGQSGSTTTTITGNDTSGANPVSATLGTGSLASAFKIGIASDSSSRSMVGNNGTVATSAHSLVSGAFGTAKIGSQSGAAFFLNGPINRTIAFSSRIQDTTWKALSQ